MIVAIVGRPNVGKSTVFNRIVGRRISIVHPTPGVTRDRVFAYGEWQGKIFGLFDTGGFWPEQKIIFKEISDQIRFAVEESDLVLFIIDGRDGVIPLDQELYRLIRKIGREMIIVVNKIDNPDQTIYDLPFKEVTFMVSAVHGHGFYDLLDEIGSRIEISEPVYLDRLRILILGRPNVGKSTLLNRLTHKKRAVVEPTPGTTRDPLSEFCNFRDQSIELIDTAGIRRKSRIKGDIEFYSVLRAVKMIPTSDLAILLFDAEEGPVRQDLRLAELVLMRGKGIVIAPNKIDLLNRNKWQMLTRATIKFFQFIPDCPVVGISAQEGKNLDQLLEACITIHKHGKREIDNDTLNKIVQMMPPPPGKNQILSLRQIAVGPPAFEIRVRNHLPENYVRFLKRKLREYFNFSGQPIIIKERCRT